MRCTRAIGIPAQNVLPHSDKRVGRSYGLAFMVWRDGWSVGVEQIDLQHKRLVEILNALHASMMAGNETASLERVMVDLLNYTQYHFGSEEKLMAAAAYPGFPEHQRKHQAMLEQVENYAQQVSIGSAVVSIKLLEFLKQWLGQHILETDRQFGEFEAARRKR